MDKLTLVVRSIKFIASKKVFLINNSIWLSQVDVIQMFQNMGLSTRTSFMKLRGCSLAYYETTADEKTTEAKPHVVTSVVTGHEIAFKKPGTKRIDWDLEELSAGLEAQFTRASLEFDDWGTTPDIDLDED